MPVEEVLISYNKSWKWDWKAQRGKTTKDASTSSGLDPGQKTLGRSRSAVEVEEGAEEVAEEVF